MRCPSCRTELPSEARFCSYCGSRLSHVSAPSEKQTFEPPASKTEAPARTSNKPAEVEGKGINQGDSHEKRLLNTQTGEQQPSTRQPFEQTLAAHTDNRFVIIQTQESGTKDGPLKNDQQSSGSATAVFQQEETQRNNESLAPSGVSGPDGAHEDEKKMLNSTGGAVAPLGGPPPVTTSEMGSRPAGNASVTSMKAQREDNSTPDVRSPAVLEAERISTASSVIQDKGGASPPNEQHSTSDRGPTRPADQQQQNEEEPEQKPPEPVQGSLSDLTEKRNGEPIKGKETGGLSPPGSQKTFTSKPLDLKPEKVEVTTPLSSTPKQGEPEIPHPLSESKSEEDTGGPAKTETGKWYKKDKSQQGESTAGKKKKKDGKGKKTEKQQTESGNTSPPPSLKQVDHGVTVVFNVMLVTNFKMEEESLHIRASGEDLGNFLMSCVDMQLLESGKGKLMRYRGQFTLDVDRAKRGTFYKYAVLKKGEVHFEYLAEFQPKYGGIMDRFLKIPDSYLRADATWHQIDGVAYIHGDQHWWERIYNYFRREETLENRKNALLRFLPKWKGFLVNETGVNMIATEALVELGKVVDCLTRVWIKEDGLPAEPRKPLYFDVNAVLVDYLQSKMDENVAVLAESKSGLTAHAAAVVSSLAIVVLVERYKVKLKREVILLLLSCLALEADPTEKKCTIYEAVLAEFSNELRKFATIAIESLCNQVIADTWKSCSEWLLAVPLLHFLRGDVKPFEEPDTRGSPNKPEWWGAQNLLIRKFQSSKQQDFSDVWPRLASAFEVDRLLKRTFLHAIPVLELPKVAASRTFHVSDLCVALASFFSGEPRAKGKWITIQQCMKSMISMLEGKQESASTSTESMDFTVSSSLDLVKKYLNNLNFRDNIDVICLAIKLHFASIQRQRLGWMEKPRDSETGDQKGVPLRQLLKMLKNNLFCDLASNMPNYSNYNKGALTWELDVWSQLLWAADENQLFDAYREFLTDELTRRARKMGEKYLLEIFCEVNMEVYDRAIGECFTKLAFEAVEKIINSQKGAVAAFNSLRSSSQRDDPRAGKYGELLSMLLTKSWPRNPEHARMTGVDPRAVEFLLTWNSMTGYLQFFGDESGRGDILTDEGRQTLALAKSLLEALTSLISNASVTVEILKLLQRHQQRFLDLLKRTVHAGTERKEDDLPSREDTTEECLVERIEEFEEFQNVRAQVSSFINMCDLIQPVQVSSIKKKVPLDVSFHKISDLCDRKENNQFDVKFFELPAAVREILPALQQVQESSTFQELWRQFGKKAQTVRENDEALRAHLTLSDVVNQVWKPAYECWSNLAAHVMDGSSTLRDIDKHFDNFKNCKGELEQELLAMFSLIQAAGGASKQQATITVKERAGQIQRYQQMHQYASAATTIWDFKEAMGFSGDFKVIEDLRNQLSPEFKKKALKSIGEKFAKAGKALECLTVKQAQCFKAVVDSSQLVEWLRDTIKSTQELKVLVDLALISAGESDMETDRISSLHTSCLGFAPLIFDLRESEEQAVSFDQLVRACEPVWKAVETDPKLPMKLADTSRHLEWLKTIQQSHGSVALTSMVQAEAINSRGVYIVGRLETGDDSSADREIQLLVNSVIRLTLPPKDDGEGAETKTYSLDELKDLQSKLMLIAGKAAKGKDEVDAFVKNLEGVMRLATAYVNLCESGFVHQLNWNQVFTCSKDRIEGESISEELAVASKQMETCYFNWKLKVSDARKEFQELNFFTTQQLMLLRREIAAACTSDDLQVTNLQVLTLLESVRPNLEADQLKTAIQHAFKNTDLLEEKRGALKLPSFTQAPSDVESASRKSLFENNNYVGSPSSSEMVRSQVQPISVKKPKPKVTSKIRSFIDAAEDAGYSEKVAVAALASLGVDAEEDDLLFWCLESADEEDIDALYEEAMGNAAIVKEIGPSSGGPQTQGELEAGPSIDESESIKESGVLHTLSSEFPETIAVETEKEGTPGDNEAEIGQYLTLSQLGSILRELALKGKGARNRTFPSYLKRGRPNLMLVPKDDVLATVLALYMHDKLQPLPSHDEVLICTPGTTTEEIELLWRRATGDFQGRFYCLVNADQLDFTVSKEAVEKLSVLTQGLAGKTGEHYGLVVICSSESEDRANIVAALDQFRVAAPPCPSPSDVRSYLKQKFKAPSPQYGFIGGSKITWTAAGSLDPENLSVRVVSSDRGGLGKSLVVRRLTEQLPNIMNNDMVVTSTRRSGSAIQLHVTVPLHGNSTDSSMAIDSLLPHAVNANTPLSRIFHLDVSPAMRRGLDTLLFNLLVLGVLCDERGRVWRRRSTDLYVIEVTTAAPLPTGLSKEEQLEKQEGQSGRSIMSKRPLYDLLPNIKCSTPRTVSCALAANPDPRHLNPLFDVKEFRSAHFQRVFQYLKLSYQGKSLDNFTFVPGNVDDDQKTCLTLLLRYCGIPDPSWSEIRHFVSFLNSQLRDCEQSFFCDMTLMGSVLAGPDVLNLNGFRSFVVRFMIQMSRDFATPSLTAENTLFYMDDNDELERKEIEQFVLRRSWESSPHPYLFFNQDHITMTFLGFTINTAGDLLDPKTKLVLEKGLMSKPLRNGLNAQRVDFTTNTENWTKDEKISKLCSVLGVQWVHDPDRAYELTMDNVKKILAIHMRFRCNIPVIVMGETGCGKTRLIRYMCGLQSGSGGPRNMLLVKVHGGTSYEDIKLKVEQAEEMARHNQDKDIDTVLFFDEANTTEALSMIKEVMVDRRIGGRPIGVGLHRLQFIAACNPYRRHTDEMIHKLESAGLGYHVKTDDSEDRLGHIPLRHLVYRVHALPGSMRPLIWDFGQLNPDVEELYTKQIVSRYILHEHQIPGDASTAQSVTAVLAASQKYMRDQSDECSFVSLRDVERAMQVMVWFLEHVDTLGRLMRQVLKEKRREQGDDDEDSEEDSESDEEEEEEPIDPITRALVLAIGVCYHAKLQDRRQEYRTVVAKSFRPPCSLPGGQRQILREITSCQQAVLNQLTLGPNIARNTALSENVFMMVVCIELRIPLFVVGKPGSSKSLAKTVVADNMQGDAARSELFKTFKQVHMASYQCSPLSTPEGIVGTFRQCSKLQEGKSPDKFVSVVVLDEVGLAEDSPLMPLKTLHPLLEDGVTSADDVIQTDERSQRVAFIGISNWALDPAKMNRGIMLSRGVPSEGELVDSAMGICSTDKQVRNQIAPLLSPLAKGYAELYEAQSNFKTLKSCGKEEFFGLRDFYSLIKMVYSIAAKSGQRPRWHQLEHVIKRNFGGLTEGEPVKIFERHFQEREDDEAVETSTTIRLIEASLRREDVADNTNFSENRYLLILTENYAALRIMQQHLLKSADNAVVIFGSSFPNDQEYTQICRNINRIKVCMETGRTVILLNLESLYESLYDALNQYYVYLGGQKYVDLGLGSHRVKCRVHDDFKLIVIAEKDVVYNEFPIPLINRLEKHYLVTSTSLTQDQSELVEKLREWVDDFAMVQSHRKRDFVVGDAFVGYHEDTIPSIVMQVCNDIEEEEKKAVLKDDIPNDPRATQVLERSQKLLIEMAAPDAIARLPATGLAGRARHIWDDYFTRQQHSSLAAFMSHVLSVDDPLLNEKRREGLFIQITTHSRLLASIDLADISNATRFRRSAVECVTLQQFQTEQQFRVSVRGFFEHLGGDSGILVVQCDSGDDNFNLIAGARHILMEERANAPENLNLPAIEPVHILVVVQLPRVKGGCRNFVGFQGGKWMSTHIDELRPPGKHAPSIEQLTDRRISELFKSGSDDEQPDESEAILETRANAVDLLRNCVQAAACRIDDEPGSAERSTRRIELLLDLLPEDSQNLGEGSFPAILIRRTYQLLVERDDISYQASEWLHSEAMSGTGVQEWGTFRKALWQRVYSAVVPILAEIIALADRDGNLDLIRNDSTWISTLWLKILDDAKISELHYSMMLSPSNAVRERVPVLGSGAGGHLFSCRFPFSCLIKERAEKMLRDAFSVAAQSNANVVDSLRSLLDSSELGPLLGEIRYQHIASLTYLMDFVSMVYKSSFPDEHELICEAILSSARELGASEDDTGNDLIDIPLVHVAYSRIQSRLRCFSRIVQAQPSVIQKLQDLLRKKESEVLLDVVALEICLEELTPSEETLLSPNSRRAWCDSVLAIRPAVEDMMRKDRFGAVTELNSNYGEKSKTTLTYCRSMWQRSGAVRLFVEHVAFVDENGDDSHSGNVVRLWKALGEDTDFSSLRSLQTIEKFLIFCSQEVQEREDEKTASEFRRRGNAFFMELVSIFCFAEAASKDVEPDALSMLMRYVIGNQSSQTKDFSPFPDYGIDPTPVVRSFLLQQLLRSSTKLVKEHLGSFLQEAQGLKPEPEHIQEVCFLGVQCMEDALIGRYQSKIVESKLTVQIKHVKKTCEEAFNAVISKAQASNEMSANALEGVAKGRYVLTLVADFIHKCFIEGDTNWGDLDVRREVELMLVSAESLCSGEGFSTPQLYLLKQLARRYGLDCVRTLVKYREIEWIFPPEARQQEEDVIQDRFIVHEDSYRKVREGVAKALISGNVQDITTALTSVATKDVNKEILLLLALYREVTIRNASVQEQILSDETKGKLNEFVETGGQLSVKIQPFAKQLLENSQGGQFARLRVGRDKTPLEHTLAEIVMHTSIALQCIGSGSLAQPLYLLLEDPAKLQGSYLPTMPEDNFMECINVIQETMKGTRWVGEWFECGKCTHPYFIGECTQPMEKIPCPDCGGVMGGGAHKFLGEYKTSERKDRTKAGHALGEPGSRSTVAEPQRSMSPIVCSLLRIIMHAAMITGACRNAQGIAQVITPPVKPHETADFIWQHLQRDLDVLGRALGRSVDDAALSVHLVLQRMISLRGGQIVNSHDMQLQNRESRRCWEAEFTSAVITPVISNLDANLQKAVTLLMRDERFGKDPLVRQLYQFDEQVEDLSQGVSPMSRSLWRYRRQITVERLGHSFQQETLSGDSEHYKVLGAFLKEEHKLRAVQFLPDIVRLQRLLMDRFHRRIDKEEAEKFTVREFLQSLPRGPSRNEYNGLFQSFRNAWNSCRSFLADHGRLRVPLDLCNTAMDNDCPIAMLLPSTTGMGVCSTSLTFFLVNTHDEFLGAYRSATNQESPLERVSVSDVTSSHLIAYDPERDLLPLILAHCNYSLEVGQETLVQYNWAALERQLIDRFLRGRPFVDFKDERFAFSRDTRDDAVFASLKEKIAQEPISRAIESQIVAEFRSSLADVCNVLSSLDIAIGFLSSSGGSTDMPLTQYLHVVLRLPRERGLKSPTAEQHCMLSHTLALWRLMALERAKILSRNKQEPFEQMRPVFKEKLSSSGVANLNRVLRRIDMDLFLPNLLEMILLNVNQAGDAIATMSFQEYWELYLAEKGLEQIPGTENIPESVEMKHVKAVWNSAVQLTDDFHKGSQPVAA